MGNRWTKVHKETYLGGDISDKALRQTDIQNRIAKAAMTTAGQEWMAAEVRIDNGSVRRSKCKQRALLLWFRG